MQTVSAQLNQARAALATVAGDAAGLEARMLALHAWAMTPEQLVRDAEQARDSAVLQQLLARRLQHEPVAQILGRKHFWKDVFHVSPHVLTPRPDSETVIETLLRLRPDHHAALRMLDLGTGSGCLLLSALREYRYATGIGADRYEAALGIAQRNVQALGLDMRASMLCSNWCSNVDGLFDVVLSNPPYIPTSTIGTLDADVRAFEPQSALDGGADGLDCYRSILAQITPYLAPQALVLMEVGIGQAADVAALGVAQKLTLIDIIPDLAGIARVVAFQHTL